jgi:hypothetical protein
MKQVDGRDGGIPGPTSVRNARFAAADPVRAFAVAQGVARGLRNAKLGATDFHSLLQSATAPQSDNVWLTGGQSNEKT